MNAEPGAARRRRTAGFGALAVAAVLLTSSCAAGRVAQTQNQRPSVSGASAQVGPIAIRNLTVEAPPQGASYPKGSALRLIVVLVNNGTATDALTDISSPSFTSWGAYSSVPAGDQVVAAAAASAAGSVAPASPAGPAPTSNANSSVGTTTTPAAPQTSGSGSGSGTPATTSSPAPSSTVPSSTAPAAPQASRTVRITANGRASFGTPDATGTLLALTTKSTLFPGTIITMTLTFARAGTVTVRVPINITTDPSQSVVPATGATGEGD